MVPAMGAVTRLSTADELEAILDEFDWFDRGQCVAITPPPTTALAPKRVRIVLRDFGSGGLFAGDQRSYNVLLLTALDPAVWACEGEEFLNVAQHALDPVELLEEADGFGLQLDVPSVVQLVAPSFEVQRLPDATERVPPWTGDSKVEVVAATAAVPHPRDWALASARAGVSLVWRTYGGSQVPVERVPEADYGGWFLQRPDRLSDDDGGLLFSDVNVNAHGSTALTLDCQVDDEGLWLAALRAVDELLPEAEYRHGNCCFSAGEWGRHLATIMEADLDAKTAWVRRVRPARESEMPSGTTSGGAMTVRSRWRYPSRKADRG